MGFFDIFKTKEYKTTIEQLNLKVADMEALLTPELRDAANAKELLRKTQQELHKSKDEYIYAKSRKEKFLWEQKTVWLPVIMSAVR